VIARLTQTDLTVMISGESGTGKELVARVLHDYGRRRSGRSSPSTWLLSARADRKRVFGHEKGAFTGAHTRMPGRFEQAEGGTLFLDEIGDCRWRHRPGCCGCCRRGVYTVGGRIPLRTDVRIIAATHRALKSQIQQGLFREDLYFRINVVPLRLPPLRERLGDIDDLVRHFCATRPATAMARRLSRPSTGAPQAAHVPGNVREMENLVRRLTALYPQDTITAEVVDAELGQALTAPGDDRNPGGCVLAELVEG